MSALSIPPSQKTNISVRLESIHNYANVLNPVTFVGTDQYSVVAVYTETEATEVDQDVIESAEVQIQTDFYEEEIVAVGADNAAGEEATSLGAEESCETVDVAKALETLTKAFALRRESIGQDGLTGKSSDDLWSGGAPDEGKTPEGHEASDQTGMKREKIVEEVTEDFHSEDTEGTINPCPTLKDNHGSLSVHEEEADVSNEDPVSETQQGPCAANVRRSTRLQMKTLPSWREPCKIKSRMIISEEPKMYRIPFILLLSFVSRYFRFYCFFSFFF